MSNSERGVIVVRILGGLGNQMFQYACGRAAALRCRGRLLLDISAFERYKQHRYGLDDLSISAKSAPRRLQTSSTIQAGLHRIGLTKHWQMTLQGFDCIEEDEVLTFEPDILAHHSKAYFAGYWQDETYFTDAADVIRSEFQLCQPDSAPSAREMTKNDAPLVSLHIRRGDYVQNPIANSVHGVLGLDYYHKAIEFVSNRIGEHFNIVVFSDDIDWARQNLVFKQPLIFISGSIRTPHGDLHLMASCDHHIIANSSFSWWGAWLNPSKEKIIVTPKRWFNEPKLVHRHICPPSWERI